MPAMSQRAFGMLGEDVTELATRLRRNWADLSLIHAACGAFGWVPRQPGLGS